MKYIFRLGLVVALASAFVFIAFAQQEMSKAEWQAQLKDASAQRDNLKIRSTVW